MIQINFEGPDVTRFLIKNDYLFVCVPVCVFGHVCMCLSVCPYFCSSFCKIGHVCLPVSLFVVCFHICGSMPVCLLSVSFNNMGMGIFVVFYLLFSMSQLIFLVVCVCLCVGVSVSIHVYEHLRIMNTFIVMIILYAVCVCFPFFIHYFFSFITTCLRNSFHAQLRKLCLMRLDDSVELVELVELVEAVPPFPPIPPVPRNRPGR